MNKNLLTGAVIVLLILAGAGFLVKNSKTQPSSSAVTQEEEDNGSIEEFEEENEAIEEESEAAEEEAALENTEDEENAVNLQEGVKTFELNAENFKFSKTEIRVKQGDRVKIVFEVNQGTHDWVIDEFETRTNQISEGQTDSVEFAADKIGTFEYYCSVGQHRQMGMIGKLIVE